MYGYIYETTNLINGKKAINNGEVQKYVKPEEIDKYLEQGWTLGPRKRG